MKGLIQQIAIMDRSYSDDTEESTEQFSISDERNIPEFCEMLRGKGMEPVFKNWDSTYREPAQYQHRQINHEEGKHTKAYSSDFPIGLRYYKIDPFAFQSLLREIA